MISYNEQKRIVELVEQLSKTDLFIEHQLFLGVFIALGDELPPAWQMNISCGRSDRIIPDFKHKTPPEPTQAKPAPASAEGKEATKPILAPATKPIPTPRNVLGSNTPIR